VNSQWYTKKWVGVSLHLLFWTLFFLSPYLLRPAIDTNALHPPKPGNNGFYSLLFLNNTLRLLLFYSNAYLLIPELVYRKKYGQYLLVLGSALAVMFASDRFFFHLLIHGADYKNWNFFVFNLFPFLFIVITSTAYRNIRDRIEENQRIKEGETENLKTELSLLRSQVSPHFMFNVLNNMVALARKGSDQLEPSLLKLSSLLRYMLYETTDKVPLQKEIEYLQSYIDLQKQRFGRSVHIHTCLQQVDDTYQIEPMLLIPFVENAFKHGTGLIEQAHIDVELKAEKGLLTFWVRNRFNPDSTEVKDSASGIGLANVQRRLTLLYGHNHSLLITRQQPWFIVSLQIALH
jgi:two-component system LytT family sensor kinase